MENIKVIYKDEKIEEFTTSEEDSTWDENSLFFVDSYGKQHVIFTENIRRIEFIDRDENK